jgi:argininosuccinate lyase
MKLWEKGVNVDKAIEQFTVGIDQELDLFLAPYDIIGSMAHIIMLESVGLLDKSDLNVLTDELKRLYKLAINNKIVVEEGIEDIHSEIEYLLTQKLGETGKKIHSGRSRNDQVLLDIKLFSRDAIKKVVEYCANLIDLLLRKSEESKDVLLPGYTHLQVAMPSSFGLWFGAYAESLVDDLVLLQAAYKIVNQNPLGSAAGYGSSFPLDRSKTTELLGFESLNYNVVYAQMGRGKVEKTVSYALANLASTLSKLAWDVCLFMSQNFGFVSLPPELTTGSSIMPHKKNPDVFELIRAKSNKIQGLPFLINNITNNLPSGYFRDLQIIKEIYLPSFNELTECIGITSYAIENLIINKNILDDKKYDYLFSVDEVNKFVLDGMPFREAYRKVAILIEEGHFNPTREVKHTHEGSIGNLCSSEIGSKKSKIIEGFNFEKTEAAIRKLMDNQ